jgi:hypothetical protein
MYMCKYICENEYAYVNKFAYIYMHIYKHVCIYTARKERLIAEEADDLNEAALIAEGPEVLPIKDVGTGAKEEGQGDIYDVAYDERCMVMETIVLGVAPRGGTGAKEDVYDVAHYERCMVMETTASKGSLKGVGPEGSLNGIWPEGPYVCNDPHAVCMILENDDDLLGFGCEDTAEGIYVFVYTKRFL